MNPFNVKDNTTIDTGKLEKIFLEEGICKKLKKNDYLIRQNEKNSFIRHLPPVTHRWKRQ